VRHKSVNTPLRHKSVNTPFFVNGEVNKQNHRYWSDTNPNWRHDCKGMGEVKVMVWCGIWGTHIIGPYFIHSTLTGERYRVMLEEDVFPNLLSPDRATGTD
jgi:hypothetical protein